MDEICAKASKAEDSKLFKKDLALFLQHFTATYLIGITTEAQRDELFKASEFKK